MEYNEIILNNMSATLHIIPEEAGNYFYIHWYIDYEYFDDELNIRTNFRTSYKTFHECAVLLNISAARYRTLANSDEVKNDVPYYVTKLNAIHAIERLLYEVTGKTIIDNQTNATFKVNDLSVDENNNYYDSITIDLIIWNTNTNYFVNMVTLYNGVAYKSTRSHISNDFYEDLKNGNWRRVASVINVEPDYWITEKIYKIGQLAQYNSIIYYCNIEHTSTSFDNDIQNWKEIHNCISYTSTIEQWSNEKTYQLYDVVLYDNKLYICIVSSSKAYSTNFMVDDWKLLYAVPNCIPNWKENTKYDVFDTINYCGTIYICIQEHTSSYLFQNDISLWKIVPMTNEYRQSSYYLMDDCRTNDKNLYIAITKHNQITYTSKIEDWQNINKYDIVANEILKEWKPNTSYYVNNCILYNNRIYVCIHKHVSGDEFNYDNFSLLSDIPLASTINGWLKDKLYEAQDYVLFNNTLYMCTTKHYSQNFYTDINNWNILREHNPITNSSIPVWQEGNEYLIYDVVLYDNDFYVCTKTHESFDFSNFKKYIFDNSRSILLWEKNVHYYPDNLVIRNDILYICLQEHISHDFFEDSDFWKILSTNGLIGLEEWLPKNEYYYKDVVIYDNELYSCMENHISDSNFFGDYDYWQKLTNFQMFFNNSRINAWSRDKHYKVSDYAIYNGNLYQCVEEHTSTAIFTDDILYWDSLTDLSNGTRVQVWSGKQLYNKNDLVIYNNDLYICSGTHVSSNFYTDIYYWHVLMEDDNIKIANWIKDKDYKKFDLTIYNNYIYCCIQSHTSTDFIEDYEYWTLVGNISESVNEYLPNHNYHPGDIIIYNSRFYLCIHTYTSPNVFIYDKSYWELLNNTCETIKLNNTYKKGDLVFYDSYVYKCLIPHTVEYFIVENWQKIMTEGSYLKNMKMNLYKKGINYIIGDIVIYNDIIYECIVSHHSDSFDEYKWTLINKSIIHPWKRNVNYVLNDCVLFNDNIYRCVNTHLSNIFISDVNNWDCLTSKDINITNWAERTSYFIYNLILYQDTLYVCLKNHISSDNFEQDENYWGTVTIPDTFYDIDDNPLSDEEVLRFRNTLLMYIDLYGEDIAYTMFKEEYWKFITSLNNEKVYFNDENLY